MSRGRIVVCDDDADLRDMVAEFLTRRGFAIAEADCAAQMVERLNEAPTDAVILDINMPGTDGLTALRDLRATGPHAKVPVVMLTAASDVTDRIIGLELGADDYLGKPVNLRELEARLKAVLRRTSTEGAAPDAACDGATNDTAEAAGEAGPGAAPAPPANQTVAVGVCTLDLTAAKLLSADGTDIPITAMEFALLKVFVRNKGRVLNRDQLLEQAHDRGWDPFDRSIDIRISRLRRKIEQNPQKPQVLRTVRGIGYVFGGK
ncbi:MAG: response regulator [Pseudomonadota bacterium]